MTSLQTLFARLLADQASIADLEADPDAFARKHDADPADARRLCAMDLDRLRVKAVVVQHKKRTNLQRSFYPAAFALIRDLSGEHADLRRSLQRVGIRSAYDRNALDERLRELHDALGAMGVLPVLREVIRFEQIGHELRDHALQVDAPRPARHPELRPGAMVATFAVPVAKVHRRVLARRPYGDLRLTETSYVLWRASDPAMHALPISASVREVLAACDGATPSAAIASRLGHPAERVDQVLEQAQDKGILHGVG